MDQYEDFAFVAGNNFLIAEDKVGDTVIKSYYYKDMRREGSFGFWEEL